MKRNSKIINVHPAILRFDLSENSLVALNFLWNDNLVWKGNLVLFLDPISGRGEKIGHDDSLHLLWQSEAEQIRKSCFSISWIPFRRSQVKFFQACKEFFFTAGENNSKYAYMRARSWNVVEFYPGKRQPNWSSKLWENCRGLALTGLPPGSTLPNSNTNLANRSSGWSGLELCMRVIIF